jgi:hypothetical protein
VNQLSGDAFDHQFLLAVEMAHVGSRRNVFERPVPGSPIDRVGSEYSPLLQFVYQFLGVAAGGQFLEPVKVKREPALGKSVDFSVGIQ